MIIKELQVVYNKLFLAICFLAFFSCNTIQEKEVVISAIETQNGNRILKNELVKTPETGFVLYKNEPFTGISFINYPNGNIAEEIFYVKGKKQGSYKKWYQDGILSFKSFYKTGLQHGTTTTWWKDGKIRSQANHVNGIVNGVQKQWYKEGELFKELNIVNGKEEGLQRAWRKNGKIYNNYEAKNGRIFGLKRAGLCYELEEEIVQSSTK